MKGNIAMKTSQESDGSKNNRRRERFQQLDIRAILKPSLYPKDRADELFFSSLGNFTDDFFESVESARAENFPGIPREIS